MGNMDRVFGKGFGYSFERYDIRSRWIKPTYKARFIAVINIFDVMNWRVEMSIP